MLDKFFNWPFLQEPAYKWFVFLGLLLLFMAVWNGVLREMR